MLKKSQQKFSCLSIETTSSPGKAEGKGLKMNEIAIMMRKKWDFKNWTLPKTKKNQRVPLLQVQLLEPVLSLEDFVSESQETSKSF